MSANMNEKLKYSEVDKPSETNRLTNEHLETNHWQCQVCLTDSIIDVNRCSLCSDQRFSEDYLTSSLKLQSQTLFAICTNLEEITSQNAGTKQEIVPGDLMNIICTGNGEDSGRSAIQVYDYVNKRFGQELFLCNRASLHKLDNNVGMFVTELKEGTNIMVNLQLASSRVKVQFCIKYISAVPSRGKGRFVVLSLIDTPDLSTDDKFQIRIKYYTVEHTAYCIRVDILIKHLIFDQPISKQREKPIENNYKTNKSLKSTLKNSDLYNLDCLTQNDLNMKSTIKNETFSIPSLDLKESTELIDMWTCDTCFNVNDQIVCVKCGDENGKPCHRTLSASWNCETRLDRNKNDSDLCGSCDDVKHEGSGQFINDIARIKGTTVLPNQFESEKQHGSNNYLINEGNDLMGHYDITVTINDSVTSCACCKSHLIPSQGFLLHLCNHVVCGTCIRNQIISNKLNCPALVNNTPCGRLIELNEIKYVLTSSQYEQFKTTLIDLNKTNSLIQRCYNKSCRGYHLWEKHYQSRPKQVYCNKCNLANCLQCKVIHDGLSCKQYNTFFGDGKSFGKETSEILKLVREVRAEPCPKCQFITK